MPFGSMLYVVAATVCAHAAIVHLSVGLGRRPRDPVRLSFAAVAASAAAFALTTSMAHAATTVDEYVAIFKGPWFVSAAAMLVASAWFIGFWTGFRPPAVLLALGVVTGALVVVNLLAPQGLLMRDVTDLQQVSLLGERMALHVATGGPSPLIPLINAALFAYYFVAASYAVRRRGVAASGPMLVAIGVLTIGGIYDAGVDSGAFATPYMLPFASFVLVAIMGAEMLREVRSAEAAVARHNEHLQAVVTERTQSLQDVNAELAHRVDQLDRMQHITRLVAHPDQLSSTLAEVLEPAGTLLAADLVRFEVRGADGDPPVAVRWASRPGGPGGRHPDHRTGPRQPRGANAHRQTDGDGDGDGGSALRHAVRVPLRVGDVTYGWMVAEREAGPFTDDDRTIADTVAADVGGLVERRELQSRLRRAATIEERRRIARELHESVTQTLYATSMIAEALPHAVGTDAASAQRAAHQIRELSRSALAELRALLLELRPERLAAASLRTLLRDQADALATRFNVEVHVQVDGDPAATTEAKLAIHRAARELLSNITRHADAARVDIRLGTSNGRGRLTIVDDGVGFVPDEVGPDHHGLAIARERLAAVDGGLQVASTPGQGTRAVVTWQSVELPGGTDADPDAVAAPPAAL